MTSFSEVQLPITLPTLENNVPEYMSRPVPPHCPPLHLLSVVLGGRGSGKTTFALKLIRLYDKAKSFDRIVVFSTTADLDPKMKAFVSGKGVFADVTHHRGFSEAALQGEIDTIEADLQAWDKYKRLLAVWDRFVRAGKNVDAMAYEDLLALDEELDWAKPKPPTKSGMFPSTLVVFDDLVGTRVFRQDMSGLGVGFTLRHRHLGCSLMILSQSHTSFVPKQLRANNIGLWVLFETKSEKAMHDIAEDVSAKIPPEQFIAAWKFAVRTPHTPFVCDYDTHDPKLRFRVGLDKLIVIGDQTNVADSGTENEEAQSGPSQPV